MTNKNNSESNVIEFPKEKRVSVSEIAENVVSLPVAYKKQERSKRREWIVGSLASIFVLALIVNQQSSETINIQTQQSRSLASVSPYAVQARDTKYEKAMVAKIAEEGVRKPASLGYVPTQADDFQYGFLESKYAVKFYQGKVQELSFTEAPHIKVEPRYLKDRPQFLSDYRELFPMSFSSARSVNREITDEKIMETYELISVHQTKVGQVHFELDKYGRLLAMKVSSLQ